VVDVTPDDLYEVGTICRIRQVFRIQNDTVHLLVTGVARAKIAHIISENPHYTAQVEVFEDVEPDEFTAGGTAPFAERCFRSTRASETPDAGSKVACSRYRPAELTDGMPILW
jgi:ATP-dependent Lon protease